MIKEITIKTAKRVELIEITGDVNKVLQEAGVKDGFVCIYVPHTTAGITINENADPSVVMDIIDTLEKIVPRSGKYRHTEGNADSHVKATLVGSSVHIPFKESRMLLGTWQGIFFCEFDGPRMRRIIVSISQCS